jgi:hypothetical protein
MIESINTKYATGRRKFIEDLAKKSVACQIDDTTGIENLLKNARYQNCCEVERAGKKTYTVLSTLWTLALMVTSVVTSKDQGFVAILQMGRHLGCFSIMRVNELGEGVVDHVGGKVDAKLRWWMICWLGGCGM